VLSGFVTVTSTVPAACPGVVAEIDVALTAVTVADAPPMLTVAPAWKFVPVIVTPVPPNVVPELGEIPLTVICVFGVYSTPADTLFRIDGLPTACTKNVCAPLSRFNELSGIACVPAGTVATLFNVELSVES
jgi:hypothetical protein